MKKNHIAGLMLVFIAVFLLQCHTNEPSNDDLRQANGETLAQQYCTSCHDYPEPDLLDKKTWEKHILPKMGYMMGFFPHDTVRRRLIEQGIGGQAVVQANIFPEKPTISPAIWSKIQAFYLQNAPLQPIQTQEPPLQNQLKHFRTRLPNFRLSPPSTTFVKIMNDRHFYIGDAHTASIAYFKADMELLQMGKIGQGMTALHDQTDALWVLTMGAFSPTDAPVGQLVRLPKDYRQPASVLISGLKRPVHADFADFDDDGNLDVVIAEFGRWVGCLSLWRNKGNGQFEKQILAQQTGAINAYFHDFNGDGRKDVIALFGQGDEHISVFLNQGNGKFNRHRIRSFSPSHGSANLQLVDFDQDGDADLLYTAGDAADFPPIEKPYQGVYLFENKGNLKFELRWFYHLTGAYKPILQDFDQDGDLDLAVAAFFPDYEKRPQEGFVYLENTGNFQWLASTMTESQQGRWIALDCGDLDGDGDLDLLLGSLAFEVVPKGNWVQNWVKNGLPFLILENTTR